MSERKPMTDEELAAIQGRLKNITPPPWFHVLASIVGTKDDPEASDATCVCCTEWGYCGDDPQANAAFIANAPTDIARLLAEVEQLLDILPRLKSGEDVKARWVRNMHGYSKRSRRQIAPRCIARCPTDTNACIMLGMNANQEKWKCAWAAGERQLSAL